MGFQPIQERTFTFSLHLIHSIQLLHGSSVHASLLNQLFRSGTSIGANIAEGQGGSSRKDFLHYLCIARKSAYETKYWLRLVNHQIPSNIEVRVLIDECEEIIKIVSAIILKIRQFEK